MTFDWKDPLLLDGLLDEDELMVRDSAKRYCEEHLQPRILKAHREEHFDRATCGARTSSIVSRASRETAVSQWPWVAFVAVSDEESPARRPKMNRLSTIQWLWLVPVWRCTSGGSLIRAKRTSPQVRRQF